MSGAPSSPFSLLLTRQRSAQQRERLHQLRDKCGLQDDDALWAIVAVIEAYCDDLHTRSTASAPATPPPPAPLLRWAPVSLGMGMQVLFLALAYRVGEKAAASPSLALWSVPAGWMVFVLSLPALALLISTGWRTRRTDPWVGWGLTTLGVVASAASLAALITL